MDKGQGRDRYAYIKTDTCKKNRMERKRVAGKIDDGDDAGNEEKTELIG